MLPGSGGKPGPSQFLKRSCNPEGWRRSLANVGSDSGQGQ